MFPFVKIIYSLETVNALIIIDGLIVFNFQFNYKSIRRKHLLEKITFDPYFSVQEQELNEHDMLFSDDDLESSAFTATLNNHLYEYGNNDVVIFCSPDDVAELAVCAADSATTLLEITLADIPEVSVDYRGTIYIFALNLKPSIEYLQ